MRIFRCSVIFILYKAYFNYEKLKQELTDAYIALTNENNKLTLDEFIKGFEDYLNDIDNNTIDFETYDIDNR